VEAGLGIEPSNSEPLSNGFAAREERQSLAPAVMGPEGPSVYSPSADPDPPDLKRGAQPKGRFVISLMITAGRLP